MRGDSDDFLTISEYFNGGYECIWTGDRFGIELKSFIENECGCDIKHIIDLYDLKH